MAEHGAEDGAGDVLDSWEELEDTVILDKKLKEITISENQLSVNAMVTENDDRTPYQPQVKILKRKSEEASTISTDQRSNNKPMKTLEQREAEYAEARRRIMGAGYIPPDNEEVPDINDSKPPILIQKDNLSVQRESNTTSVQVIRQPRGPDGTTGFDSDR